MPRIAPVVPLATLLLLMTSEGSSRVLPTQAATLGERITQWKTPEPSSLPLGLTSVIDTAFVWTTTATLRHFYAFDPLGQRTLEVMQKLAGDVWVDSLVHSTSYDGNGLILTDTYDYITSTPHVLDLRVTYTYDESGRCLVELKERGSDGQWQYTVRHTYSYDQNGHLLSDLDESYSIGQWKSLHRDTYTYNAQGQRTASLTESWNNGTWENIDHHSFTFDSSGRDSTDLWEQWDGTSWRKMHLESYMYDAMGKCLYHTVKDWCDTAWVDAYRYAYLYDGDQRRIQEQVECWYDTSWVATDRKSYTYTPDGQRSRYLVETIRDDGWENEMRWDYTYDASGRLSSWTGAFWIDDAWQNHDWLAFGLVDSAKNEYWFHRLWSVTLHYKTVETGFTTGDGEVPAMYALEQNYPNPFNPSTTIRYAVPHYSHVTLTVYNILGQQVSTLVNGEVGAGYHEVQFKAEGLASGPYFCRLQAGGFVQTRSFCLIR